MMFSNPITPSCKTGNSNNSKVYYGKARASWSDKKGESSVHSAKSGGGKSVKSFGLWNINAKLMTKQYALMVLE